MAYSNLADLLADLNRSTTFYEAYLRDKAKVWKEYNLSPDEQALLADKNTTSADLKKYLHDEYFKAQMINQW